MYGLPSIEVDSWKALVRLFDCPWFRRVWVIQEVAESASAEFIFSSTKVDWLHVRLTVFWTIYGSREPRVIAMANTRGNQNSTFMAKRNL